MKRSWFLLSAILASCDSGTPDDGQLRFTPESIQVTTFEGDAASFHLVGKTKNPISQHVNIAVSAGPEVLTPMLDLTPVDEFTYRVDLEVSGNLSAGIYQGTLELRLCSDDPLVCARPYPGSPWRFPYAFTIKSSTHLTPLRALPGAGPWATFQGNASHTGHVPGTVDPSAFDRRFLFRWFGTEVALSSGRAFVATEEPGPWVDRARWTLRAIDEATGQEAWATPMGDVSGVNTPAVSNGKVYVVSTGQTDSFFWVFDATTGEQLAKTAMDPQTKANLAPTPYGDAVYTASADGLSAFDAATGTGRWSVSLDRYASWTPAVDQAGIYADMGGRFYARRPSDGGELRTAVDPHADWAGYAATAAMLGAPVLDGQGNVFLTEFADPYRWDGRLVRLSLADGSVSAELVEKFSSNPVLAGGTLYVVNGPRLEARSPQTNAVLWSWMPTQDQDAFYLAPVPLVVVGDHAFLALGSTTYAVDLTTHQTVWSEPHGGPLAVSENGILYVTEQNRLYAYNLH